MKIYDISQEVFSCVVYPGDSAPEKKEMRRTARGDLFNLTDFSMCAHNGTHIDAPFHFIGDGKTVEAVALEKFVGDCYVANCSGLISSDEASNILKKAAAAGGETVRRILIRGAANVDAESATVFAEAGIDLIGIEGQSVGDENAPMEVHKILLAREVVLLEGIRLGEVEEGKYFLSAAPISLAGADGAPCRAILVKF